MRRMNRESIRELLPEWVLSRRRRILELYGWRKRGYRIPAPTFVKHDLLSQYGLLDGIWIETGTFRGITTAFLAKTAKHVYSIEPGPELVRSARKRFAKSPNVTIIEGLSEHCLGDVLEKVSGNVSFWLDGHWSEGITFKGPIDTPILQELQEIENHLGRLDDVRILIDDMRCFDPENEFFSDYPSRSRLVDWADSNGLFWTIESDIFVACKRRPR